MKDHIVKAWRRQLNTLVSLLNREDEERRHWGKEGRDERNAQPSGKDERQAELKKLLDRNPKATVKQLHMDLVELGYEVTERTVRNDLRSIR